MMKKQRHIFNAKKIRSIINTPIIIALSILAVAIGLLAGMYAVIQDSFFQITCNHEMELLSAVESLGGNVLDAKLGELKRYCADMLVPVEIGLIPLNTDEREEILRKVALPKDGLNLAYWSDGTLICQDDSFKADLEALDLRSVAEEGTSVIFDPYFDEAGNYILTVAASSKEASGVFIAQYDGFCMTDWLNSTVYMLKYGTAYIVDSEGYNIATTGEENIEWVTTRYNAQIYAEQDPNTENVSIAQLEGRAIAGETGIGTYEWNGGTSYVAFGPLTEAPWGYCVGFYEWEFMAYTKNVVYIGGRSGIVMMVAFGTFMSCIIIMIFRSLTRERKYNQLILIQKMEAEMRNIQDPLTGVKNKRAWQEAADRLDEEIQAGTAQFAVVVCDINGLKQLNDTLGHEAGDDLIIRASRYICKIFSHSPVYRVGGDEFVIILRGDDLRDSEKLIGEFDRGLTECSETSQAEQTVSIALGISHYQPGDMFSSDVFHRADKAMYQKKATMKTRSA